MITPGMIGGAVSGLTGIVGGNDRKRQEKKRAESSAGRV